MSKKITTQFSAEVANVVTRALNQKEPNLEVFSNGLTKQERGAIECAIFFYIDRAEVSKTQMSNLIIACNKLNLEPDLKNLLEIILKKECL
jgi:hypothetical protein